MVAVSAGRLHAPKYSKNISSAGRSFKTFLLVVVAFANSPFPCAIFNQNFFWKILIFSKSIYRNCVVSEPHSNDLNTSENFFQIWDCFLGFLIYRVKLLMIFLPWKVVFLLFLQILQSYLVIYFLLKITCNTMHVNHFTSTDEHFWLLVNQSKTLKNSLRKNYNFQKFILINYYTDFRY